MRKVHQKLLQKLLKGCRSAGVDQRLHRGVSEEFMQGRGLGTRHKIFCKSMKKRY